MKDIHKLPATLNVSETIIEEDTNSFLYGQLNNYYKNDVLALKDYPDNTLSVLFSKGLSDWKIDLTGVPTAIKEQFKCFLRNELGRLKRNYTAVVYNFITPIICVIPYVKKVGHNDIFSFTDAELYDDYIEYCNQKNYSNKHKQLFNILRKLKLFTICYQQLQIKDIWERDIWNTKELKLAPERFNNSDCITDLYFFDICNSYNKKLLKLYLKKELAFTSSSYTTIIQDYRNLKAFISFLGNTNIGEHTRKDILSYYESINKKSNYNHLVGIANNFFDYLCMCEVLKDDYFIYSTDYIKKHKYDYKLTAPDDFVVFQIFDKLPLAEPIFQIMYLIQGWCGIRVSELCCIPFNCIRKDADNCKLFIHSQKMQNDDYIIIPEALYSKIKEYQAVVKEKLPDAEYLFYSPRGEKKKSPIRCHYYIKRMKDYIREWDIKNQDGTDYEYTSHAYRHKKAKDMVEAGIPIYMISQCLNHKSCDMTLAYAEARTEYRKREFSKYIAVTKDVDPLKRDSIITIEWLRDNLDKQALPNGYCCLPCQISCPHNNSCIHCENFITGPEYIDIHKNQLLLLETQLENYELNGYIANVATVKKDIEILKDIINRLEAKKYG